MSKFAVYLRELLDQRGEPIARIAKNAGLERTSIHKVLKDERVLPYTALNQLIQYLQLTLAQVRELNQYYEMLLQGEDVFQIQGAICDLLSELSQLPFSPYQPSMPTPAARLPELPPLSGLICGRPQAESVIGALLSAEAAEAGSQICLYLPADCSVPDLLLRLWRSGLDFSVRQLAAFLPDHSAFDARLKNLHLLQKLIPLSLVSRGNYYVYYHFEDNAASVNINPLTYFILTPHYLITADDKFSVAQVQQDPALIQLYQRRFNQIAEECQPLNSYIGDPEHILKSYMNTSDQNGYYTIMTQPCLGHYYTRELIERQLRPDLPGRKALAILSDRRFEILRKLNENYYTIFSESGLRQLAADGIAADIPSEYINPFSISDRLTMFRALRQDMESGTIHGCIADIEKLPIPPNLTLTCDPKYGVHIYTVRGFGGGMYACNLHIRESSIGQSFCEFIRSLPGSKFVYPKEKTRSILDQLILQLETEAGKEERTL